MRERFKKAYISYVYLFILFLGTVVPINSMKSTLYNNYTLHIRWDYLLHFAVYLPLPVLLAVGFAGRSGEDRSGGSVLSRSLFWIVVVSVVVTVFFESLQLILPYRNFNINDMMANGVGVVLGFVVLLVFRKGIFRAFA